MKCIPLCQLYIALCNDLWSRQRVVMLELKHIQSTCAALLKSELLSASVHLDAFKIYLDIPLENDIDKSAVISDRYQHENAGKIYLIAQELKKEISEDHISLRKLLDGDLFWMVREELAKITYRVLCETFAETITQEDKSNLSLSEDFDKIFIPRKSILNYKLSSILDDFTFSVLYDYKNFETVEKFVSAFLSDLEVDFELYEVAIERREAKKHLREKLHGEVASVIAQIQALDVKAYGLNEGFPGLFAEEIASGIERFEVSKGRDENKKLRYLYYKVLVLKRRVGAFAGDMGVLSRRCSELLERSNPKQPSSSINKRQDMAFYDHFIKTFCNHSFKDLLIFCKDEEFLDATYPGDRESPLVIHSTTHQNIAEVKSFLRDNHYEKWRNWILNPDPEQAYISIEPSGANALAVLNSFFIEIPTSIPIAVHELAHRVIREFFGKYIRHELLSYRARYGVLGDFLRKYFISMDQLNANFQNDRSRFVQVEVLADLLAACRCGPSYLYAWLMEVLPSEHLDMVHLLDEFERVSLENIDKVVHNEKLDYYAELPVDYVRGVFVLELIKGICDIDDDQCTLELTEGFREYLHLMLAIRYRTNKNLIAEWRRFPSVVRTILYGSGFMNVAKNFRSLFSSNQLKKTAKNKNKYGFVHSQVCSQNYQGYLRSVYEKKSKHSQDFSSHFKDIYHFDGDAVDFSWRILWVAITNVIDSLPKYFPSPRDNNNNDVFATPSRSVFQLVSQHSYLDALAKEDYVAKSNAYTELFNLYKSRKEGLKLRHPDSTNETELERFDPAALSVKDQEINRNSVFHDFLKKGLKDSDNELLFSFEQRESLISSDKVLSFDTPIRFHYEPENEDDAIDEQNHMMVLEFSVFSQEMEKSHNTRANLIGNGIKDDKSNVESVVAENYQLSSNGEPTKAGGIVLGTYDYFVLSSHQETAGFVFRNDYYPNLMYKPAYIRRRCLMPLSISAFKNDLNPSSNHKKNSVTVLGFVLIALKSHSLRWFFLAWLEKNSNTTLYEYNDESGNVNGPKRALIVKNLVAGIYFSQGWEDIVLALKMPSHIMCREAGEAKLDVYYTALLSFITRMAEHPIVETTETIFTRKVFDEAPLRLISKFRVRVSHYQHFVEKFKSEFAREIENGVLCLVLTSGYFDYEVVVMNQNDRSGNELIQQVWKRLAKTEGVDRIVTDLGFQCPKVHSQISSPKPENIA